MPFRCLRQLDDPHAPYFQQPWLNALQHHASVVSKHVQVKRCQSPRSEPSSCCQCFDHWVTTTISHKAAACPSITNFYCILISVSCYGSPCNCIIMTYCSPIWMCCYGSPCNCIIMTDCSPICVAMAAHVIISSWPFQFLQVAMVITHTTNYIIGSMWV